jgi:hypothetical protein
MRRRRDALRFVVGQLYASNDETTVVLRAHLVLEGLLWQYLERRLPNYDAVRDGRLSFAQLVCITAALQRSQKDARLWEALKRLNALRNELAHDLDEERYRERRTAFLASTRNFIESQEKTAREHLRKTLVVLCGLVFNLGKRLRPRDAMGSPTTR